MRTTLGRSACDPPGAPGLSPGLAIYLEDVLATPLLGAAEERELLLRSRDGDPAAREHLIRANLPLVVSVAKGLRRPGHDLEDLIEDGNLGLIRAVDGFDPAIGTRLSTYAVPWIKQAINRAISNAAMPVRVPEHVLRMVAAWRRAEGSLRESLGRPPTEAEVARAAKVPAAYVRRVSEALAATRPAPRPHDAANAWNPVESCVDPRTEGGEDGAGRDAAPAGAIGAILDGLGETARAVVAARYGLGGDVPRSFAEIGAALGVSAERARQVGRRAERAMRIAAGVPGGAAGPPPRPRVVSRPRVGPKVFRPRPSIPYASTGARGVYLTPGGRFKAVLQGVGVQHYCGIFDSREAAEAARDEMRRRLAGVAGVASGTADGTGAIR